MSGTPEGGRQAAATNKQRYGEDFYKQIGRAGKQAAIKNGGARYGGFAYSHELAVEAGRKGGKASRRIKKED